MSATESASTTTSKENDSKMYTREFDLEDEKLKHSSEGANTLDNIPKRTKASSSRLRFFALSHKFLFRRFSFSETTQFLHAFYPTVHRYLLLQ